MLDKPNLYRRTRDRFSQLSVDEYKEAIRHFKAYCSYEDWLFGRLVKVLKDEGQYDNTVIIFTSDHGDYCGEHGLLQRIALLQISLSYPNGHALAGSDYP